MIRLNVFFEAKDADSATRLLELASELVEKSRNDDGCVAYDVFQSATRTGVMMICETWADQHALDAHSASVHFTNIVPMMEALTCHGLKLERFEF